MIIEIEHYKGDIMLTGKARGMAVLKRQIAEVEKLYDRDNDNFTELLCRMYGWTEISAGELPDITYDRDTGFFF